MKLLSAYIFAYTGHCCRLFDKLRNSADVLAYLHLRPRHCTDHLSNTLCYSGLLLGCTVHHYRPPLYYNLCINIYRLFIVHHNILKVLIAIHCFLRTYNSSKSRFPGLNTNFCHLVLSLAPLPHWLFKFSQLSESKSRTLQF